MTAPDKIWAVPDHGYCHTMGEESAGKAVGHKKYLASTPPREHAEELLSFVRTVAHGRHNMATAMTQARALTAKIEQKEGP